MIQINNLNKSFWEFPNQVDILKDVNLKIETWDFIAIIWPSWSWKSTLLNMISWLDRDYRGEIIIWDQNIVSLNDDELTFFRWKNISYIFQNFKLIENLTVWENVDLIVELNSLERNFQTDEILKLVWLYEKKDNYVFNLSWWESQRVAIARAFVGKTELLLADEPTWSLDQNNKKIIMDLIVELHQKTQNTIIMITHDFEVAKMASKTYSFSNYWLVLE